MTVPDVVTIGETMALLSNPRVGPLRHATSLDLSCAGAESNLAIGLSRLGHTVCWIGRVGADEFGALVRRTLVAEGVDVRSVVVDPDAATGLMVRSRRTDALTRVTYYRSGSAGSRLCADDVDCGVLRTAQILHVTGITPALSASARAAIRYAIEFAAANGVVVSLDINYRQALWPAEQAVLELRELARQADILFATEPEARLIAEGDPAPDSEALAVDLAALGPTQVLLKRGAEGGVACIDGAVQTYTAYPVTQIDPIGAGDAFAAGYLSGLLDGEPVEDRLRRAALAGAFAVSVSGDWEGLPDRAELAMIAAQTSSDEPVVR
ncbi:MAG: sugar kinase [Micromonosporaceae bacterium]|nr:sugar kinase [Micromonosporaceae bacterium]